MAALSFVLTFVILSKAKDLFFEDFRSNQSHSFTKLLPESKPQSAPKPPGHSQSEYAAA
jgi:hypothetical protein